MAVRSCSFDGDKKTSFLNFSAVCKDCGCLFVFFMYADDGNQHGDGNSENSDIAKLGVPLLADGDQSDLRQQQAQEQEGNRDCA